uniref:Serpentine Receptor, class J n=1 Tax=Caenorhabditis tropicalis TaxID=1561998 RepID=A0A1I7T6S4_9PELO
MINSDLPILFDKIGFAVSFIANLFMIYLTVFHIKKMSGTYKKMVIMFAICGIIFTLVEVIARPFAHNYNKCLAFFSLNTYLSQNLVKEIIFENYGLVMEHLVRFIIIPYASDNSLRWKNLLFCLLKGLLVWLHYAVIVYCGLRMHFNMKKELNNFSIRHRKLHKQFFYALVAQSLGPTVLLFIPAAPLLLTPLVHPYMNMEINWQTGWLFSLMSVYPPFDSIAFMLIVTEYRKVIMNRLSYMLSRHPFKRPTDAPNINESNNGPKIE